MKDDHLYLIHIQEAIERIEEYTQEGEDVFLEDHKTQDAVLRNLHTLAESSQRISNSLKEQYPQVDWRIKPRFVMWLCMIIFRRVWEIVENDLPGLKENIAVILKTLE